MKVVINCCYGGFSVSREGVLLGRQLSGDPKWGGACIKGDVYEDTGTVVDFDYGGCREMNRNDPILVQVVETLGKRADGPCADLYVEDVPEGTLYRVTEYGGYESVETQNNIDWSVAN